MKLSEIHKLKKEAIQVRRDVVDMIYRAKDGHIGGSLSLVEILLVLYQKVLNINRDNHRLLERDRFILSKGHGCSSFYAVLARNGFYPLSELEKYCRPDGILCGHPSHKKIPGVEVSTGSLGHGFPMGIGFALSAKLDKSERKIYCIVGDGECNEGSIWEAAAIGSHFKLDNIVVIVDYNEMQSSGRIFDIQNPVDLGLRWRAFGWNTIDINGHDFNQIYEALHNCPTKKGCPTAIIAHTIKARGIPFMENDMKLDNKWHTGIPTEEEYKKALDELRFEENKL